MKKNLIQTAIATLRLQREHGFTSTEAELLFLVAYLVASRGHCISTDIYAMLPLSRNTIRTALDRLALDDWLSYYQDRRQNRLGRCVRNVLQIEHTPKLAALIRELHAAEVHPPVPLTAAA